MFYLLVQFVFVCLLPVINLINWKSRYTVLSILIQLQKKKLIKIFFKLKKFNFDPKRF